MSATDLIASRTGGTPMPPVPILTYPTQRPIQSRRPYQNVGFVSGNTSGAWSNYNALTFRVEKRFSQGLVRAWAPTLGQRRWALGLRTTGP